MTLQSFKMPMEKGVIRCTNCLRPCCMLNSALLGGIEARTALQDAMFDPELPQIDTDWCVGSCSEWKGDEEGEKRMALLRQLLLEWGEKNPEAYAEFRRNIQQGG